MNDQLYGGPQALKRGLVDRAADSMSVEYGDLRQARGTATAMQSSINPQSSSQVTSADHPQDDS